MTLMDSFCLFVIFGACQ